MSADVVEYARLMACDELATIARLFDSLRCVAQEIVLHGGRVVDAPGDNLLAEFESESAALHCAVRVQRRLADRNRHLPHEQRMLLRIGLHCGELLAVGERLYGSAVNVAARLQQAAAPASVFVSESVAERVEPELSRTLLDLGRCRYKNIFDLIPTLRTCVSE